MYPEIAPTMGNRKSVVFKVTMSVFAKSMDAKDDLRAFVWDFGQEHNQVSLLSLFCVVSSVSYMIFGKYSNILYSIFRYSILSSRY